MPQFLNCSKQEQPRVAVVTRNFLPSAAAVGTAAAATLTPLLLPLLLLLLLWVGKVVVSN